MGCWDWWGYASTDYATRNGPQVAAVMRMVDRLGEAPARQGEVGCLYDLVPIAWQHGFFWGGNFPRRPDGMHFEVGDIALD